MTAANDLKAQVKAAWTSADILPRLNRATEGNVRCLNPEGHNHGDKDPSAVVYPERLWCPVCGKGWDVIELYRAATGLSFKDALHAMARERGIATGDAETRKSTKKGSKPGTIDRTYDYKDENGVLLFQVVRFRDPKDFRQRRPDPEKRDGWNWSLKGVRRVLYQLPEILKSDADSWVFVVEGEKDVENLRQLGLVATCNPMGAGKWIDTYSESLTGRKVAVLTDNDDVGREHATAVAKSLHGVADDVRLVDLGLTEIGADVSDWIAAGGTAIGLLDIVERTKIYNAPAGTKPDILLAPGRLLHVLKECELALVQDRNRDAIFDLNGRGTPCRVLRLRKRESYRDKMITREPMALMVSVLDEHQSVQRLMRAAKFWSQDKLGNLVPRDCPERIGKHFIRKGRYDLLPPLTGIISAPTIRPDGSVLDTPGYDEVTGLLFDAMPDEFPALPTAPTRADALAALAVLEDLLSEFPYASTVDRSAGVSSIVTTLLRRSMDIAPAHSFNAPDQSAGKTTHAHLPALIATGRPSSVMAWPDNEEERRKSLFSILLAGDQVAVIDNIDRPLQSGVLCAVITTPEQTGRILGVSRNATVSTSTSWMITGNNLELVGDLTSRVVPCRLNPKMEFAETREFKRDIMTHALQHRGEIVRAALTIVLAYFRCGERPKLTGCRFSAWNRLVREPLVWIGLADPMEGARRLRRSDAERERLAGLMEAWNTTFADAPMTLRDVIAKARNDTALGAALAEVATSPRTRDLDSRTLSYFLRSKRGKIINDKTFEPADGVAHGGVSRWALVDPKSIPTEEMSTISTMSTAGSVPPHGGDGGDGGDGSGRSESGSGASEPSAGKPPKSKGPHNFWSGLTDTSSVCDEEPDSGLAAEGYVLDPDADANDGGSLWTRDRGEGSL